MTRKPKPRAEARRPEEMLMDFHRSMRRSMYVLSSGEPSDEYADVDGYYLGGDGDLEFDRERAQLRLRELVEQIVPKIVKLAADYGVNRLAFPEKRDDGPVGMLAMMDLILFHSGLDGCIVRPNKRLLAARIKGRPIGSGEQLMIVSDVATLGNTIARPAACLRELGGVVPAAFVLLDRCQGAKESLAQESIELISYWTIQQRNDALSRLIEESSVH
jgi:hypothetical protein